VTASGWIACALAAASGTLACSTQTSRPPQEAEYERAVSPPARATPPAPIPETARAYLRTRMGAHASNLSELMRAVAILSYPEAIERADAIASDASLARPVGEDATLLNSMFPEEFFRLQDGLREDARALGAAAKAEDTFALGEAFSRLSRRCVDCHRLFRPQAPR